MGHSSRPRQLGKPTYAEGFNAVTCKWKYGAVVRHELEGLLIGARQLLIRWRFVLASLSFSLDLPRFSVQGAGSGASARLCRATERGGRKL